MNFNAIKSAVLSPFGKKKVAEDRVIRTIAVIFNLANHASLMAATLFVMVHRFMDETVSVVLVDIRDRLPQEMDQYVWIDAGGPDVFTTYCQQNATAISNPSAIKLWCKRLEEYSIVLTTEEDTKGLLSNTSMGKAITLLGGVDCIGESLHMLLTRYGLLSQEFMQTNIDVWNYCKYYAALEAAYNFYMGHDVGVTDISKALAIPEEVCEGFDASQKRVSKAMVFKSRETIIDNRTVQYITALGPDIFNIIRRIRLAKKPFVHMSTGSYGQVVYSDIKFSEDVEFDKAVFMLTPPAPTMAPAKESAA